MNISRQRLSPRGLYIVCQIESILEKCSKMIFEKCCCRWELKDGVRAIASCCIGVSIGLLIRIIIEACRQQNGSAYGLDYFLPRALIGLVFSSFLCAGVNKEQPGFVLAWFVYEAVQVIADSIYYIKTQNYFHLITTPIGVYFDLCVLSYYQQLIKKRTNDAVEDDTQEVEKEKSLV